MSEDDTFFAAMAFEPFVFRAGNPAKLDFLLFSNTIGTTLNKLEIKKDGKYSVYYK